MATFDWIKLTALAAIWGSSFIFMKILVPVIGVLPTACLRILISGTVLVGGMKLLGMKLHLKRFFKHYLIVGVINASLPFFLYSFATLHAPASLSVIMNSTTPLFGALFALLWLGEKMNFKKGAGFFLGTFGVSLIALKGAHGTHAARENQTQTMTLLAAAAGLTAAACYALAGVYMKKFATGVKPYAMAGMSHLFGGLVLLPMALVEWSQHPLSEALFEFRTVQALLCLSLLCSAIGFLIFYHLFDRVGPTQTLTVGYLIPAFGMVWGAWFLGENIHPEMIVGSLLILAAVALISKPKEKPKRTPLDDADLGIIIQNEIKAEASTSKANPAAS